MKLNRRAREKKSRLRHKSPLSSSYYPPLASLHNITYDALHVCGRVYICHFVISWQKITPNGELCNRHVHDQLDCISSGLYKMPLLLLVARLSCLVVQSMRVVKEVNTDVSAQFEVGNLSIQ